MLASINWSSEAELRVKREQMRASGEDVANSFTGECVGTGMAGFVCVF